MTVFCTFIAWVIPSLKSRAVMGLSHKQLCSQAGPTEGSHLWVRKQLQINVNMKSVITPSR